MKPEFASIAICGIGCRGIITCRDPQPVKYADGNAGEAWTGLHLDDHPLRGIKAGDPWSSRNPKVIGSARDIKESA